MGETTEIAWATSTFNTHWGCTRVSAACDFCLPAETLVLDGRLRPVALRDLRVGDEVLGYDEVLSTGENRRLRVAVVQRKWATRAATVSFITASGRRHTASANHRWLARIRPSFRSTESLRLGTDLVGLCDPPVVVDFESDDYLAGYLAGASEGDGTWCRGGRAYRDQQWYWRVAEPDFDMVVLDRLALAVHRLTGHRPEIRPFDGGHGSFEPAQGRLPMSKVETRRREVVGALIDVIENRIDSDEFAAGWLAGIVDTDGSHETSNLRVAQAKPNDVRDTVKRYGARLGFDWRNEDYNACPTVRLYGDSGDRIRFAVTVGPAVQRKAVGAVIGMTMPRRADPVVAVARGPEMDLIDIQTSTGTFVLADGLATHNCYAETLSKRYGFDLWDKGGNRRLFGDKHWAEPLKWNRKAAETGQPWRVFCSSMADVFEDHPALGDVRARLWDLIERTPALTWMLLTKRPENMRTMTPATWADGWPQNAWAGVTAENDRYARIRVTRVVRVPAVVRFVSYEPALGDADFTPWLGPIPGDGPESRGLQWVICGGESGPHARLTDPAWVRQVHRDTAAAGVPFFMKQLGGVWAKQAGVKGKGDRLEDLPADLRVRQFPQGAPCAV